MITVPVNSKNEIVDVQEADQFQPAKTQFACGFFASAMARSMARPGQPPTLSVSQVIADGLAYYREYDGSDAISNTNGMTDAKLWALLHEIGLHFQATSTDASTLKQWLHTGYPVIIAVMETSVEDLDPALNRNPYPWTPAGSHIILLTGVASDSNFLVRDSANCTSLYDPNSLRPGPRKYSAAKLQVVSATVAVPPWMPRPASATPPTEPPIQVNPALKIPTGWTDNGASLIAPNGGHAEHGFRDYILGQASWDPADMLIGGEQGANPVELGYSQPDGNNAGSRLITMYSCLCYTAARGVYRASVGRELSVALQELAQPNAASVVVVATTPPPNTAG